MISWAEVVWFAWHNTYAMNWLWEPLSDSLIFYLCVMLLLPAVILEWLLVVVVVVDVGSCLAQGMKEVLVDASSRRQALPSKRGGTCFLLQRAARGLRQQSETSTL